jgi:hypothetical protein
VGDRAVYQRGSGWRAISAGWGLLLPLALNIPSAQADAGANGVQVVCPDLPEARTAELEARARATLLTSDLSANAAISCVGEAVVVQVDAGGDSVTLKVRVAAATLREEVLRALDRALADLGARGARATPEGQPSAPAPSTGTVVDAPPPLPATETPPAAPAPQPAASAPPEGSETEIAAEVIGESWGNKPALGGALRAAVRFDSTWSCGIRVGALHPPTFREATVIEAHALLEVTATAHHLAGLRFGLGAGPSLLSVSPDSGFASSNATLKSALRIEAQVGRPFRFHRVELTPWVGARAFSAERGLRIADQPRLILGGVRPQLGLTLSLLH